jgi:hypothetical protein
LMARRGNVYMMVKHGTERKLVYLGDYVATRFRDTGLVRSNRLRATG